LETLQLGQNISLNSLWGSEAEKVTKEKGADTSKGATYPASQPKVWFKHLA